MELRHLRYVVAVGEAEPCGRAAARLHVVPPALTSQVRPLEAALGCALCERLTRGVRLTEAGQAFLEEARRLLADLGHGVERTRLVAPGQVGCLRVGFADAATSSGALPSILRDFRASWQDVRLELLPSSSVAAGEHLRAQEVDVAFVDIPPTHLRAWKTHTISVERCVLALPHAHPLVNKKRVRLGDLTRESCVWFPRAGAPLVDDRVLSTCHAAGLTWPIVQEVHTPTVSADRTMLRLVAGGIGLSFPIQSAERAKPDTVVLREVEDLRLTSEF
jgi:DNA-binding transcriptional LysR family regulator